MRGFLFGKLPAFGDFLSRGLSTRVQSWWDRWCSAAVIDAQARLGAEFEVVYRATEPRRFLIAPLWAGGSWQAGCLVPSIDRAGRVFPFVLGIATTKPISATDGAGIGERIATCIPHACAPDVDPNTLIAAAEVAANDTAAAARPLRPVAAGHAGWIRENVGCVER